MKIKDFIFSLVKIYIIYQQYFPVFHYFVYNKMIFKVMEADNKVETKQDLSLQTPIECENENDNATRETIFDMVKDIKIENVKCRKGRPKGSKNVFCEFSKGKNDTVEKKRENVHQQN